MKNIAILIVGIVIGYFLFSFFNSTPTETFQIKTRTIKQTNTVPVLVRDTRYHAPDSEIAPPPEAPVVKIKVEPMREEKREFVNQIIGQKTSEEKSKNKIQLDHKIYVGLNQLPFLLSTDSKLIKIRGQYNGTLKFRIAVRTGDLSKVSLNISEDETIISVMDAYDNIDANFTFSRSTSEVFKTLPTDENLIILMTNSESSFIFDLRDLPHLNGKAFVRNVHFGDVLLKKRQDKK